MTRQIQLFKPVFNIEEALSEIRLCLEQGWTGQGFKTVEFEEKFKEYTGLPNAHFLNSATSALHLALELVKLKYSPWSAVSEVITSPLTFISDSHVILHAGMKPVFCDVDDSLCMSPTALERILSEPNKACAVIYIGIGGNTGKLKWITDICNHYNLPLILDASHMMGTLLNGKQVGREAEFTVFSFQSVKNLPTADSGMLVCGADTDDKIARKLSWLGISKDTWNRQTSGGNWDYNVDYVGWKYHGNSIMAAIALAQLRTLRTSNAIRMEQAGRYSRLDYMKYVHVPMAPDCRPSRHLYQVMVDAGKRDYVIKEARKHSIQLGVHYKCHTEYPMYKNYPKYCPNAERLSRKIISLPIGPHLSEADISYVIEVLNAIPF